MDPELVTRLTELVEKVGLLRRDMQHRSDLEEVRRPFARIDQVLGLAELISRSDPDVATALRTAWQLPAEALRFGTPNTARSRTSPSREMCDTHPFLSNPPGSPRPTWSTVLMATFARHVDVEWTGNLMEGSGTAKAGTGAFSLPVTFPSRIDPKGDTKTTPEELMAASHAVALRAAGTITKQGGKAKSVKVTATVTADKGDAGIKVVSSHLKAVVEGLEGIDKAGLSELATGAEKAVPSRTRSAARSITVEAHAV